MKFIFHRLFRCIREVDEEYGAFIIALVTDLPLFIDPFLLFDDDSQNTNLCTMTSSDIPLSPVEIARRDLSCSNQGVVLLRRGQTELAWIL